VLEGSTQDIAFLVTSKMSAQKMSAHGRDIEAWNVNENPSRFALTRWEIIDWWVDGLKGA
jgi:hypothetical protein